MDQAGDPWGQRLARHEPEPAGLVAGTVGWFQPRGIFVVY